MYETLSICVKECKTEMPRNKAKYNALSISSPDALRQGIPASYYLLNTKSHQTLGLKIDTTSRYIRLICRVIMSRQFKYSIAFVEETYLLVF